MKGFMSEHRVRTTCCRCVRIVQDTRDKLGVLMCEYCEQPKPMTATFAPDMPVAGDVVVWYPDISRHKYLVECQTAFSMAKIRRVDTGWTGLGSMKEMEVVHD